jgi:CPA1 family monovalent cation:H+ antiporter
MMGLAMHVERFTGEPLLLLSALGGAIVSRLVLSYGLPRVREVRDGGPAWRGIIALAGMRGALAVALALSLPAAVPYRAQIIDAVFAVVLFTTVVQGLAIGPVVRRLWPTAPA